MKTDVVVIGGGPGGYVAAIRLGQLGKQVVLVEKEKVGGTCLQVGCIPSKGLIAVAKQYEAMQNASRFGIQVEGTVRIDLAATQKWKQGNLDQLTRGIQQLCKANKVTIVNGEARFLSPKQIAVKTAEGEQTIDFDQGIIATGSSPIAVPGFAFDGKHVLSSTEALALDRVPARMAVIGGGYIGLELGSLYAKLGSQVTVVEMTPSLLPGFDPEAVDVVARKLRKNKVEVFVETKANGYDTKGEAVLLHLNRKGEAVTLECDAILVTVGRRPFTGGLALEKAGIAAAANGFIPVRETRQVVGADHLYAIGDVAGQPMLAHKASKEAEVAAEHIAGHSAAYEPQAVPAVVFTDPEVASVGLSEAEARANGHDVLIGKFPFAALGKTVMAGQTEGFVKLICDKQSRAILGALIVGHDAGTMISEAVGLMEMGASVDDLSMMIHPHPTASEAYAEAAMAALGHAVHMVNR